LLSIFFRRQMDFAAENANLEIFADEVPNGKLGLTSYLPFKIQYASGKGVPARVSPADLESKVLDPEDVHLNSKITGGANSYRVEWKTHMKGIYQVEVVLRQTWKRTFKVRVLGATSHLSYLEGIERVPCGVYNYILVTVDEDGNRLSAGGDTNFQFQIDAPEGSYSDFKVRDNKDGTYMMDVVLRHPSTEYKLIALFHGENVSNSPFTVFTMSG